MGWRIVVCAVGNVARVCVTHRTDGQSPFQYRVTSFDWTDLKVPALAGTGQGAEDHSEGYAEIENAAMKCAS
jgi:hypothetical protein